MRGSGERWRTIEQLFELQCRRLGLEHVGEHLSQLAPAPRAKAQQGDLFD
jgi:hypothetical protein